MLYQKVKKGNWIRGFIVNKANTTRLYMVKDTDGVVNHRNIHYLKNII